MRPMRCLIAIGFQGMSKLISVLQNCRLRPSPPDSLHSNSGTWSRNASTAASFSGPDMPPSNRTSGMPCRRSRSAKCVRLSRWWTNTIFFSAGLCASSRSSAVSFAPAPLAR